MKTPKLTWLYLLYSEAFPFRYKIGITERPVKERIADIEHSIKKETSNAVKVRKFVAIPSFFAYRLEQYLHRKFARYNTRIPGSGGTEWFMWGNVGMCLVFLVALYVYGWRVSPAYGAVLILIPLPLDFALLLLLALCFEAVTVVGGFILLLTLITKIL